ncbi:MAG: fibronectin/fibrinogen-binding protein [Clostridiales bacterium]|nr:fibronectin/fibrinogen-binding protein [Clostridiales bacterium]
MPLDAVVLSAVRSELEQRVVGGKIDKIYQPEKDEVLLHIRSIGENLRLLISANQNNARVHIGNISRENPQTPPMFCMLMRKLFTGGIIRQVSQPPLERILTFEVDTIDELGQVSRKKIVVELIGRMSNIILLDEEDRIIDSIRRVNADITDKRQVLPGMFYRYPPAQEKRNPLQTSDETLRMLVDSADPDARADKWLIDNFFGLSPLVARETAFRAAGDVSPMFGEISVAGRQRFADEVTRLFDIIRNGRTVPYMLFDNGKPFDLTYIPIGQYGGKYKVEKFDSFSMLVEAFYEERAALARLSQQAQVLRKVISPIHDRLRRKVEAQKKELMQAKDREKLREFGDLLMANLNAAPKGSRSVRVTNFYDPEVGEIEIPLDPKLSVQQNAAKYYKDYNRMKNAERVLQEQIASGEQEAAYLESVLDLIDRAETSSDVEEIRQELMQTGYIRQSMQRGKKKDRDLQRPPREFRSTGGFVILCGRNNLQNDMLTHKLANKNDIWFHVQKHPGSHVILRCEGREPDDLSYTEAAMIAAAYSQAKDSANVAVDYTRVRNVKKIPGARPGMVIYDPYYTAYVTPDREIIEKLRVR